MNKTSILLFDPFSVFLIISDFKIFSGYTAHALKKDKAYPVSNALVFTKRQQVYFLMTCLDQEITRRGPTASLWVSKGGDFKALPDSGRSASVWKSWAEYALFFITYFIF